MMASPGNQNHLAQQPQPQPQTPFDMQKFFKPTTGQAPSSQNPSFPPSSYPMPPPSSSSYPPPTGPFSYPPQTAPFHPNLHPHSHPNLLPHPHHQQFSHPHSHIPGFSPDHLNNSASFPNLHIQRSISFPTPPLQPQSIPPPTSSPSSNFVNGNNNNPPNAGARLMALLSAPAAPSIDLQNQGPASAPLHSVHPPPVGVSEFQITSNVHVIPGMGVVPVVNPGITQPGPIRMPSSKLPKGRHLIGDHIVYDVDVRLYGEVQPQLEVTPITKYGSDPQLVLGRQIAVNKCYICYGLKQGNVRVLNINTALRSLLRGHTQRVTDLAFFAEDVHLLASVGIDQRVYVWKISEGPDEEDKSQISGRIIIAIQIAGDEGATHPRICWHCHKQEVLVVGIGKRILRIDTTKVGKGEVYSAEEPLHCAVDKLCEGVQLVGRHEAEVSDLSMCQWMKTRLVSASLDGTIKIWEDRKAQPLAILRPHDGQPVYSATFFTAPHRPDHIILITAGPLNRELKLWAAASEEGWLLPSDAESWKCTQTLDLKSSSESQIEDAFFNQVASLSQAGLLLLANAKKNAIYGVHLEYGPNPASTRLDYIAEFTVTMPILSFTGTSEVLTHGEQIVQVYCVQTQAIQQYALDLTQCLPPPLENASLEKLDSNASHETNGNEGFSSSDTGLNKSTDIVIGSAPKEILVGNSESMYAARYPVCSGPVEAVTSTEINTLSTETKLSTLKSVNSDANVVCVGSPHRPVSPKVSKRPSEFRKPSPSFEPDVTLNNQSGDHLVNDYPVDRQMETSQINLSDLPSSDSDVKNDEKKVIQDDDISRMVNPPIVFKHPTHLITPSEIIKAGASSEANSVDKKREGEAKFQDVVVNSDMSNTELEVKVVGETLSSSSNAEFGLHGENQLLSDSKEKFFSSQASDLGIEMARQCSAISGESYVMEEQRQSDATKVPLAQPSTAGEDSTCDSVKDTTGRATELSTSTGLSQTQTPGPKGKRQKGKNSQASGPSTSSTSIGNSTDSFNEPVGSSSQPSGEITLPQMMGMQETINQLITMQKEMQKQMTTALAVPVTKESRRLEAALGRTMEKAVKANTDALWARFQEENAKNEKLLRERMQQITNIINNFMNKDLSAMLEKTVKKEMAAIGPAVIRAISPGIEKTIASAIVESFQRGVGDKAVNQLDKSVNAKLEATVARQIQAQFQTTGKQALQDTLKSSVEASLIPAFEMSCKAMFEQVDVTFQKGMLEHLTSTQQHFESLHSPLAMALRDAINSATAVTQTLSVELVEGQHKLLAIAAAGGTPNAVSPLVSQPSSVPLGTLHEKVEVPVDPTKELSRLISERKYEEAFIGALQRSDVTIVSWLCCQVDLRGMLSMVSLPLSQGVLLSLLQQLACDINQDTQRKLGWMIDVASAINPADPMIAVHVRPIFEQVYQILNHQRSLPSISGVELSCIRLLMHVITSLLMTCK